MISITILYQIVLTGPSALLILAIIGAALALVPLVLNKNSNDPNCIDESVGKNPQEIDSLKMELTKCQQKNKALIEEEKIINKEKNIAEEQCKLVANKKSFIFHSDHKYIFTDISFTKETGIRATAINGRWDIDKENSCKPNEGDQYLKGKDFSQHLIEIREEGGGFKSIGIATSQYNSSVHISKEGKLGDRGIHPPESMRFLPDNGIVLTKEIREKVCLYDKHRRDKHNLTKIEQNSTTKKSQPCATTIGEQNNRIMVAFICKGYSRVMIHNNLNDSDNNKLDLEGIDLSCQE